MSYATLVQARAEGITLQQADDLRLQSLLDAATRFIDDATGWWFSPRAATLRLDGTGLDWLPLSAPPITVTSVVLDGSALTVGELLVDGVPGELPDRRHVPQLARPSGCWARGRRNVVVAGTFGFVEADLTSPPPAIREACLRLAVRDLALIGDAEEQIERRAGEVFREQTDGHSYERGGVLPGAPGGWRNNGLTSDPDIDRALERYRRPPAGGRV